MPWYKLNPLHHGLFITPLLKIPKSSERICLLSARGVSYEGGGRSRQFWLKEKQIFVFLFPSPVFPEFLLLSPSWWDQGISDRLCVSGMQTQAWTWSTKAYLVWDKRLWWTCNSVQHLEVYRAHWSLGLRSTPSLYSGALLVCTREPPSLYSGALLICTRCTWEHS